jgi:ABC-2 type transport system permease protein
MRLLDRPVALVAGREVREGLRSKGFIIMLAISVVAIAGLVAIFHFAGRSSESSVDVVVVGGPASIELDRLDAIGEAIGTRIDVDSVADDDSARAAVADGSADLALLSDGAAILIDEPIDADDDSEVAAIVNVLRADIALNQGLAETGLSADEIAGALTHEPPEVRSIEQPEDDSSSSRVGVAIALNIVLFLLMQTYGGWVVSGVTREKASRVVEVLLATVTTRQLMFGKIIGIGVVAMLHAAALVTTALVTAAVVGIDVPDGFRAGDILVGAVWFLLGYSLYCCAFAAAGSLCSRAEDAQGAVLPIMLPLLAGYIIAFSAFDGATPLLWFLAFFPPTAVMCMPVLYAIGEASVWMVLLSMALTVVAAYLMARLAAAIYSRSILKTGKRVGWREALRSSAPSAEAVG